MVSTTILGHNLIVKYVAPASIIVQYVRWTFLLATAIIIIDIQEQLLL